jgi:hypothetical protein
MTGTFDLVKLLIDHGAFTEALFQVITLHPYIKSIWALKTIFSSYHHIESIYSSWRRCSLREAEHRCRPSPTRSWSSACHSYPQHHGEPTELLSYFTQLALSEHSTPHNIAETTQPPHRCSDQWPYWHRQAADSAWIPSSWHQSCTTYATPCHIFRSQHFTSTL